MSTQPSSDLLTIQEFSEIMRVDDTTSRRWVKNGVLEAVVLPHAGKRQSYRIQRRTLDTLLNTTVATA